MSADPQLFRIDPSTHESEEVQEVDFTHLGFRERRNIQEWIAANPGILGEELLIIGKEFSGFDRTNERLDLLAVDVDGRLVVIELKRDDSGVGRPLAGHQVRKLSSQRQPGSHSPYACRS